MKWTTLLSFITFLIAPCAHADVAPAKVFSDHMVLQQGKPVPVWGTAAPHEQIRVSFAGQLLFTAADDRGRWLVRLAPLPSSDTPAQLTIAGNNTVTISDVLVGEVWLCSGQSNMEYPLNRTRMRGTAPPPENVVDLADREYTAVNYPKIRLLRVEKNLNTPDLPTDGWKPCTGIPAEQFSSVAFFFGKELHEKLRVPVGLIQSAWGGSRIEPWTPPDAYAAFPALAADAAKTPGKLDGATVGNYYNKLIAPLAPFAARGVIWYQGESNIISGNDGMRYFDKFEAFVHAWRNAFHNPELSFIQVQLVPYRYSRRNEKPPHPVTALPELWEAQEAATRLPNVGMVVTNDLADDLNQIHPWNKWDIGQRLALWALANDYGRTQLPHAGPRLQAAQFLNGKALLTFDHAYAGLKSRDGQPLSHFTIAGQDGNFVPAHAEVTGPSVVSVSSPDVPNPTAVRFAWHETAQPNLVNSANLPAGAFRTDKPRP